ncbi:MAG: hypothetical protein M3295_07590, partial [Chloroflexota bacterium]|nr:hypothetical protein [Chloroflexota bacterium]
MELLIALIPALPAAGFVFSVLVGPRLDRMPAHHAGAHPAGHATGHATDGGHGHAEPGGEGHAAPREAHGEAASTGGEP